MRLAGEYKLYREALVVDDLGQTVEISKEQMSALVSGETDGETELEDDTEGGL